MAGQNGYFAISKFEITRHETEINSVQRKRFGTTSSTSLGLTGGAMSSVTFTNSGSKCKICKLFAAVAAAFAITVAIASYNILKTTSQRAVGPAAASYLSTMAEGNATR